jgi:hypothetical protein
MAPPSPSQRGRRPGGRGFSGAAISEFRSRLPSHLYPFVVLPPPNPWRR